MRRATSLGVRKIIVVSSAGRTAKECAQYFNPNEFDIIVVTDRAHSWWPIDQIPESYRDTFRQEWPFEVTESDYACGIAPDSAVAQELYKLGVKRIVQGTEVFRGILWSSGLNLNLVVAETLKLFGDGVKVAIECALMACDAGAVEPGETIISIALPPMKSHAALVIQATPSDELFGVTWQRRAHPGLRVREIISKGWY
ncbi:MAG: hypothetical protein HZB31_11225 [Nitrospirae bacterium]|nr:hypothetical protein [Nitrospirota bacterium]